MVLFGISTGARQQEICQLQWTWEVPVDGLPHGAVWAVPAVVRKGNAKKAASDQKGRYLVCNAMARSVIDSQRGHESCFVFPGKSGKALGAINNTGWQRAWKQAGLPMQDIMRGVHNLRHTFGERLDAVGTPWEVKKVLLGHEIGDVTALYSQPGLKRLLEWAEKVTRDGAPVLRPVTQNVTHIKTAIGNFTVSD
jgi:integrase